MPTSSAYSYQNLWDYLKSQEITKVQFQQELGISSATLAKMNRNEKISDLLLKKISEKYNLNQNCIYESKSDIQIWLKDIYDIVKSDSYTLYHDAWPKFVFVLNDPQAQLIRSMHSSNQLENLKNRCEYEAHQENQPNNGQIIGGTKIEPCIHNNNFVIQGSFAVIKKMVSILFLGKS